MIQLHKQTTQQNKKAVYFGAPVLVYKLLQPTGEVVVMELDLPSPIQSTKIRTNQQILLVLMSLKLISTVTVTEFYTDYCFAITHTHTHIHTYIHTYIYTDR